MGLKATLITGGSVMVIGGAMIVTGLSTGAKTTITWDNGPKIVKVHKINQKFNNKNFKKITIDGGSNSYVRVVRGSQWRVSGKYLDSKLNLNTTNDELKLALRESNNPIFGIEESSQTVVVAVPYKVNLDNLNLTTDGSGITTQDISAKNLTVRNDYGGVRLNQLTAQKIDMQGDSGNYRLQNVTADTLHVNSGDGYFKAHNLTLKQASQMQGDNQQIELHTIYVPGINVANQDSSIYAGGADQADNDYHTGDQSKALTINGANNDVTIK